MQKSSYKIDEVQRLRIVRDDLIPGGTKQRGLARLLPSIEAQDIVYPGTVLGYGALALAEACRGTDKQAVIFISPDKKNRTDIPDCLKKAGADIRLSDTPQPLRILEKRAQAYAEQSPERRHYMAPGFKTPDFKKAMTDALSEFPGTPEELWVGAVSGTMAHILEEVFSDATIHVVAFARHHGYQGRGRVYQAPEKYHQPAKQPPPYPSFAYCDAKIWQFATKYARPGALIWNMGA